MKVKIIINKSQIITERDARWYEIISIITTKILSIIQYNLETIMSFQNINENIFISSLFPIIYNKIKEEIPQSLINRDFYTNKNKEKMLKKIIYKICSLFYANIFSQPTTERQL